MSTDATTPASNATSTPVDASQLKGKAPQSKPEDVEMADEEEEEDDDDEEEDDEGEDEDEEDEEDNDDSMAEIDPKAILGGRRTRGVKVDYTSEEALRKAGISPDAKDDDE
ncbi:hypothetical protein FISHEDRAFT_57698 [Fistulina hepatica ATCC 64428]|uniref:Histone chaperone domain-containing protein n=1 Tax=Fistulina hepatica ATCC 64428 TaxID=1128425 RepID=A0A0D7AHT1_9AGAR|nr:hypothetical protein FISHEDRAFT_57698 [Fistulina hepatica ATCC 64428]